MEKTTAGSRSSSLWVCHFNCSNFIDLVACLVTIAAIEILTTRRKVMLIKKFAIALVLAAMAPLAFAAGATKIAVLDIQAVVLASDAGKSGMGELEKKAEYADLKAKAETLEADLKAMDEQAKNESLTWGEDKKNQHREKMTEMAKERQNVLMTLNRAREAVFMQLLQVMEPAIGKILEEVMAAEGIELVIDSKSAVHKVATADITPMVVDRLNKLSAQAVEKSKAKAK